MRATSFFSVSSSADVDRAERLPRGHEEAVDLGLARQIRPGYGGAAELGGEFGGPLLAAVVVDEDVRSLGHEEASARGADPT